jgi:hypothetical protein
VTPVAVAECERAYTVAVLFANPGADADGFARVTFDATVRRPDGRVFGTPGSGLNGTQERLGSPAQLTASRSRMNVVVTPTDPAGVYTVEVVVHDNARGIAVPLTTRFEVK